MFTEIQRITSATCFKVATLKGGVLVDCLEPTKSDAWFAINCEVLIMREKGISEINISIIYNGDKIREVYRTRQSAELDPIGSSYYSVPSLKYLMLMQKSEGKLAVSNSIEIHQLLKRKEY